MMMVLVILVIGVGRTSSLDSRPLMSSWLLGKPFYCTVMRARWARAWRLSTMVARLVMGIRCRRVGWFGLVVQSALSNGRSCEG